MANTKEIQKRMKSIQDTMKITNAMYMISSTKMRQAKKKLADTEPYFYGLQGEISRIRYSLQSHDCSVIFRMLRAGILTSTRRFRTTKNAGDTL